MNQIPAIESLAGDDRPRSQGEMLTNEQVGAVASTFTWRELETRFRDIQAKTEGHRFTASFIRTEWDSGSTSEDWFIGGTRTWRKEFEDLASIAARKLGYARSEDADKQWLDHVREWMQQEGLDKDKNVASDPPGSVIQDGVIGKTHSLETERIADLSAMFCVELMTRGTPESAVSRPSERTNGKRRAQRNAGRKPTRNPEFDRYAGTLWRHHQGPNGRVSDDCLKRIAADLDQSAFSKPSDYLEARAAEYLNDHNQKFGNSPKKFSTWSKIAVRGTPSLKSAMRKLLSRCSTNIPNRKLISG